MKDFTQKSAHGKEHHRVECECDVCYPPQMEAVSDNRDADWESRCSELETEVELLQKKLDREPYICVGDKERPTLIAVGGWWVRLMYDKKNDQHYLQLKKCGVVKLEGEKL